MSFTLKKIKRDKDQGNLYNIFTQTIIDLKNNSNIIYYETIVTEDEEMRLDLVSKRIYGEPNYIEELMQINNIVNIWNIKIGDKILYTKIQNLQLMQDLEVEIDKTYKLKEKQNKNTRIDPDKDGFVPVVKPRGFESVSINHNTKKIKIHGKLS